MGNFNFLVPNTRIAFIKLRSVFTKVSILKYFNLEYYI